MNVRVALLIVTSVFSVSSFAEIALRFNYSGEFVSPGEILQERAVRAYKKGQVDSSMQFLKRSVKFGNETSKYMIALMYLEKKDLVTSYSWLKFVKKPIQKRNELLTKLGSVLTESEKSSSDATFSSLKEKYSDDVIFKRRTKWSKNKKVTGTNIAGLHMLQYSGVILNAGTFAGNLVEGLARGGPGSMNTPNGIRMSGAVFSKTVDGYLIEYHPKTRVYLRDIKEIDSND